MSNTDLLSGDVEPQAASSATSDSGEQAPQSNGAGTTPKRRPGGLSGMVIAELRELAAELGITGTTGMRKGDLIAAIRERQGKTKRTRTTAKSSGSAGTAGVAAEEATLPLDGVGETKAERGEAKKEAKQNDAERSADAASEQTAVSGTESDKAGAAEPSTKDTGQESKSSSTDAQDEGSSVDQASSEHFQPKRKFAELDGDDCSAAGRRCVGSACRRRRQGRQEQR